MSILAREPSQNKGQKGTTGDLVGVGCRALGRTNTLKQHASQLTVFLFLQFSFNQQQLVACGQTTSVFSAPAQALGVNTNIRVPCLRSCLRNLYGSFLLVCLYVVLKLGGPLQVGSPLILPFHFLGLTTESCQTIDMC